MSYKGIDSLILTKEERRVLMDNDVTKPDKPTITLTDTIASMDSHKSSRALRHVMHLILKELPIEPSKPTYEELEKLLSCERELGSDLLDNLTMLNAALDRAATKISDLTCRDKEVIINELMKGEIK